MRNIGPSLVPGSFSTSAVPADQRLELRYTNGTLLVANNYREDGLVQAAEIIAAGLAPTNNFESAIAALLAGRNDGPGIGLVEVYDLGTP